MYAARLKREYRALYEVVSPTILILKKLGSKQLKAVKRAIEEAVALSLKEVLSAEETVQFGMTATVTIGETGTTEVARLPLSSLHNQGGGPAVWVVGTDGRPALRPVTVAAYQSHDVLVTKGVSDGDRVVILGVQKLDPGQRVRIVETLRF